jgi:hypothetical protein
MMQLYGHLLAHSAAAPAVSSAATGMLSTAEEFCMSYLKHMGTRALSGLEAVLLAQNPSSVGESNGEDASDKIFHTSSKGLTEIRRVPRSFLTGQEKLLTTLSPQQLLLHKKVPAAGDSGGDDTDVDAITVQCSEGVSAVVSLLTRIEETVTARLEADTHRATLTAQSPPSSSGATSGSRTAASATQGAGKSTAAASAPTAKAAADYQGSEYLASELFLCCLSGFLQLSANTVSVTEEAISPAQYGVTMLQLQERLPSTALLRDGEKGAFPSWCCRIYLTSFLASRCRRTDFEAAQGISGGKQF